MAHKDVGVFLCADIPFAKVGVVFPHGAEDKYLLPDFMKVREYLTANLWYKCEYTKDAVLVSTVSWAWCASRIYP